VKSAEEWWKQYWERPAKDDSITDLIAEAQADDAAEICLLSSNAIAARVLIEAEAQKLEEGKQ